VGRIKSNAYLLLGKSVERLPKIPSLLPGLRFQATPRGFLWDDLSVLGEGAQEAHYL